MKLFNYKGRLNRKQFWILELIFIMINGGLHSLSGYIESPFYNWFIVLFLLFSLILTVFASIKRLHDIDYSGWWLLLCILPLLLGIILSNSKFVGSINYITFIIFPLFTVIGGLTLIFLFLKPGNLMKNRYGEK
ncbi:MAG: DUF805 domain-containing protein [Flavobacteriales bacterium]